MIDVTFKLAGIGDITRKMFALSCTMAGFGKNLGIVEARRSNYTRATPVGLKSLKGVADLWWLSSRRFNSDNDEWSVWAVYARGYKGDPSNGDPQGVVFAFVIPSKTLYDLTPNTDGSYNLII